MRSTYRRRVFINCPFDDDYWPLMQAIVFAVQACGFIPRCASEADDAGEERLEKITRIIGDCRLSIHDLSRKGPDPVHGLSRFNMPLEMGLCLGAKSFGQREKTLLVMETQPFDYRKFMSDIAGRDIKHHGDDPAEIIRQVRSWLNAQNSGHDLPGGQALNTLYRRFRDDLPSLLGEMQLDESEVKFIDWSRLIEKWLIRVAGA
jgi:hypothetical protein